MKSKLITQALLNYRNNGGTLPLVEAYKIINNMNFAEGGDLPESGLPEKNPTIVDADNNRQGSLLTGMMKARMAIAAQMGNTSAQRMTSIYPNRYEFTGNEQINGENIGVPKGEVGTHFMASMDEYAVPFIQERNNKMQFISNPRYNDPESMRFESPEDAEYFAEHYKDVAPMMQSFEGGGELPDTVKNPYSFPIKTKSLDINDSESLNIKNSKNIKHKDDNLLDDIYATLNPKNWGVTDYTDKGDFNTAYNHARKIGEKEFMWNNKRYSTDIPKSNSINKYISDNVYPYGTWTTTESDFKIDYDELMQLKYYTDGKYTPDKKLNRDDIKKITRNDKGESMYDLYSSKGRSSSPGHPKDLNASYDALSLFNNQLQKYNSFTKSKYIPTDSKNPNTKYYSLNNKYEKQIEEDLLKYNNKDFITSLNNKRQVTGSIIAGASLRDYQYSKGKDDRGNYVAYYDINDYSNILDLIPNTNPFEIYGRIYYKDYGDKQNKRMYYSDKELSELDSDKKNFDTLALQRELSNRGYKLSKSIKEDGTFDGIWGDETKTALLDYQNKNKL